MRTTVTIPDEVLEDLMRYTEARTRTEAVNWVISEWVRRRKIEEFKSLRGKVWFEGDIDELRALDIQELKDLDSYGSG